MHNIGRKFLWILIVTGLMVSFQNCGRGFRSLESSSNSAQCLAKLRADAPSLNFSATDLNCADFNAYACERRIFSPDAVDMTESLKECTSDNQICVDVEVRQFNTSAAANTGGLPDGAFAAGGEFNHEEIHCYHRMIYHGTSLFEGSGDSLDASLAAAMAACEKAVSK